MKNKYGCIEGSVQKFYLNVFIVYLMLTIGKIKTIRIVRNI